jgi:two-component system cell cycle response regulator CpdR
MMPKILLAEDDNDMRRFLVKALEKAGYEVRSFDNGASAYDRLREEPFNLLLTDIVMPEMDGIELARRATELGACSSAGEHYIDIVGVTGSIPVTPTI